MNIDSPRTVDDSASLAVQQDQRPDKKPSRVKKDTPRRMPAEGDPSLTKELILRLVELIKQV